MVELVYTLVLGTSRIMRCGFESHLGYNPSQIKKNKTMKKLSTMLAILFVVAMSVTSCKKAEENSTNVDQYDTTEIVTDSTQVDTIQTN